MCAVALGSWGDQRPSLGDYVTGTGHEEGDRCRSVLMLPTLLLVGADSVVERGAAATDSHWPDTTPQKSTPISPAFVRTDTDVLPTAAQSMAAPIARTEDPADVILRALAAKLAKVS